jgi:hypothetical protein
VILKKTLELKAAQRANQFIFLVDFPLVIQRQFEIQNNQAHKGKLGQDL